MPVPMLHLTIHLFRAIIPREFDTADLSRLSAGPAPTSFHGIPKSTFITLI
jgi:hypothetical protein